MVRVAELTSSKAAETHVVFDVRCGQRDEFIVATMNISDDVEGSVVSPTVNPQRLANDRGCFHGLHRIKDIHVAESLPLEASHRALHLVSLAVNHA